MPIGGDEKRSVPDARRNVTGRSKGNKNALRHGWYTAEAIAMRQVLASLRRYAKQA